MARKTALEKAIDELLAKRDALIEQAKTLELAILELREQSERQPPRKLKSGPVALGA